MVQLSHQYDYWKNHTFDSTDICQQSDVSAFEYAVKVCQSFPSKKQVSFNFVTAVSIISDFGAQGSKFYHCSHFSPSICHEVMEQDAVIVFF